MLKAVRILPFAILPLAIATNVSVVLFGAAAQAQTVSGIAGAIYPRASDRFFEEGRDAFERETQQLADQRLAGLEGKLAIDETLQRQLEDELRRREDPRIDQREESVPAPLL